MQWGNRFGKGSKARWNGFNLLVCQYAPPYKNQYNNHRNEFEATAAGRKQFVYGGPNMTQLQREGGRKPSVRQKALLLLWLLGKVAVVLTIKGKYMDSGQNTIFVEYKKFIEVVLIIFLLHLLAWTIPKCSHSRLTSCHLYSMTTPDERWIIKICQFQHSSLN